MTYEKRDAQTNSYINDLYSDVRIKTVDQALLIGENGAKDREIIRLKDEIRKLKYNINDVEAQARAALKDAEDLIHEWQASMEAWKELALLLKEEVENCPNHEAHPLGKSKEKMNKVLHDKEDQSRVRKSLKPRDR